MYSFEIEMDINILLTSALPTFTIDQLYTKFNVRKKMYENQPKSLSFYQPSGSAGAFFGFTTILPLDSASVPGEKDYKS
jgi:hypothetical protein